MEELGLLALERVTDELEDPAHHEHRRRHRPKFMPKERDDEHRQRRRDQRDPYGMAEAVDRVLVGTGVLRDPLFVRLVAEHRC